MDISLRSAAREGGGAARLRRRVNKSGTTWGAGDIDWAENPPVCVGTRASGGGRHLQMDGAGGNVRENASASGRDIRIRVARLAGIARGAGLDEGDVRDVRLGARKR